MACEHERIKCVNCEFYCVICGEKLTPPQKPAEPEKPKRKTRKGATKE